MCETVSQPTVDRYNIRDMLDREIKTRTSGPDVGWLLSTPEMEALCATTTGGMVGSEDELNEKLDAVISWSEQTKNHLRGLRHLLRAQNLEWYNDFYMQRYAQEDRAEFMRLMGHNCSCTGVQPISPSEVHDLVKQAVDTYAGEVYLSV